MLNYRKLFRLHATGKASDEVAEAVGCPKYIVDGAVIRSEEIKLQWPIDPSQSNEDIESMLYKSKALDKNSLDNQYMDVANESLATCGLSPFAQAWKNMPFDDHREAEKDLVKIRDNNKENSEIFRASGDALFFLNTYLFVNECARRTKGKWGGTYSDKLQSALTDLWDECSHKWRNYKADIPYVAYMIPNTPEAEQEKKKFEELKKAEKTEIAVPISDVSAIMEYFYDKNQIKIHIKSEKEIQEVLKMHNLYSQDIIMLAAKECKRVNGNISDTLELLKSWKNKGLKTKEDIEDYIRKFHDQTALLKVLYNHLHINKKISQEHRVMADEWLNKLRFSHGAIVVAATKMNSQDQKHSKHEDGKKLFEQLHVLLHRYAELGIFTVEQIEEYSSSNKTESKATNKTATEEFDPIAAFETLNADHQSIVFLVAAALSEDKQYTQKA